MKLMTFIFLSFSLFLRPAIAADAEIEASYTPIENYNISVVPIQSDPAEVRVWCALKFLDSTQQCTQNNSGGLLIIPIRLEAQHGLTPGMATRQLPYVKIDVGSRFTLQHSETGHVVTGTYSSLGYGAIAFEQDFSSQLRDIISPNCAQLSVQGRYISTVFMDMGCGIAVTSDVPSPPPIESLFLILIGGGMQLNPLSLNGGTYKGEIRFNADFGDNYRRVDGGNSNELVVDLTINVNHQLRIAPVIPADQIVNLQPCKKGQVCNRAQGEENWERWMVNRIPPELTGRSNFRLSASTKFKMYLDCSEKSGPDCAIRSDKTGELVPVKVSASLPNHIVDNSSGSSLSDVSLSTDKDSAKILRPTLFKTDKGAINFLVEQKDVKKMLASTERPEIYRGQVTIMLEPTI